MAKKFQYKLQAVLRYREMIEDERKREFALANREVEEQKAKAEQLEEERLGLQGDLRKINSGGTLPFNMMLNTIRYIAGLDMGIVSSRREEERLRQAMEGKRQAFINARRDKKALEILRDKKREEYEKELDRERQLVLDELSLRMLRKRLDEEAHRANLAADEESAPGGRFEGSA